MPESLLSRLLRRAARPDPPAAVAPAAPAAARGGPAEAQRVLGNQWVARSIRGDGASQAPGAAHALRPAGAWVDALPGRAPRTGIGSNRHFRLAGRRGVRDKATVRGEVPQLPADSRTARILSAHLVEKFGRYPRPGHPVGRLPADSDVAKAVSGHLVDRLRRRELLTVPKAGQAMAAESIHGGGGAYAALTEGASAGATVQPDLSSMFRRLVDFDRFDQFSKISVLADEKDGGLTDDQMRTIVDVNSEFMKNIKPGMTVNKIIPDSAVELLGGGGGRTSTFGDNDAIGGSVAHRSNYLGLTGAQSVSNFGLDYGGYTDEENGVKVALSKGQKTAEPLLKDLSSYVAQDPNRPADPGALVGVPNVFYYTSILDQSRLDKLVVPIHTKIKDFAEKTKAAAEKARTDPVEQAALADALGARVDDGGKEINDYLTGRLDTLDRFIARANFPNGMRVTTNLAGTQNRQDPLTNLGGTRAGSRMPGSYSTVNQEYYLPHYPMLEGDSRLFLKDEKGQDHLVAELRPVGPAAAAAQATPGAAPAPGAMFRWVVTDQALIDAALARNKAFRAVNPVVP